MGLVVASCDDPPGASVEGWVAGVAPAGAGAARAPQTGDVIVTIDGGPASPGALAERVGRARAGDRIELGVVRAASGGAGPVEPVTVVLRSRQEWSGPLDFEPLDRPPAARRVELLEPQRGLPLAAMIEAALRGADLERAVGRVYEHLRTAARAGRGFHALEHVLQLLERPERIGDLQASITRSVADAREQPGRLLRPVSELAGAAAPRRGRSVDLSQPNHALNTLADLVSDARGLVDLALLRHGRSRWESFASSLERLLISGPSLGPPTDVRAALEAMRATMDVGYDHLFAAAGTVVGLTDIQRGPPPSSRSRNPPRGFERAVRGKVLRASRRSRLRLVFGGYGSNTYDMSEIDVVIDPGGNDVYLYDDVAAGRVRVIVDMAGDDQHRGRRFAAGAARLGVSLLVDYQGNDVYDGGVFSIGSGLLGVGMLVDHGGADEYTGSAWVQGTAAYGAGVLADLGDDGDVYRAAATSQGVGGPRGVGLLFDQGGHDLYAAIGGRRSAYGTDATFFSLSQGVGVGIRRYDTGGIGVLYDGQGDDRYVAGEFSQGGGYFWGFGLLRDDSGDDLYFGDRYSQGFAAHQAAGVLVDGAGDDTYWGTTAAAQAAAWDESAAMLIDRSGNDTYRAGGLSQGAAAMQSVAILFDGLGSDHYVALRGPGQGASGRNTYHHDESGAFSWSVLLDAGGQHDFYSLGRENDTTVVTGVTDADQPGNSQLHGLFIDLPRPLSDAEWW